MILYIYMVLAGQNPVAGSCEHCSETSDSPVSQKRVCFMDLVVNVVLISGNSVNRKHFLRFSGAKLVLIPFR
jgi:hypothetical protein